MIKKMHSTYLGASTGCVHGTCVRVPRRRSLNKRTNESRRMLTAFAVRLRAPPDRETVGPAVRSALRHSPIHPRGLRTQERPQGRRWRPGSSADAVVSGAGAGPAWPSAEKQDRARPGLCPGCHSCPCTCRVLAALRPSSPAQNICFPPRSTHSPKRAAFGVPSTVPNVLSEWIWSGKGLWE